MPLLASFISAWHDLSMTFAKLHMPIRSLSKGPGRSTIPVTLASSKAMQQAQHACAKPSQTLLISCLVNARDNRLKAEGVPAQKDYKSFSPMVDWDTVDWSSAPAIQETNVTSAIVSPSPDDAIEGPTDVVSVKVRPLSLLAFASYELQILQKGRSICCREES